MVHIEIKKIGGHEYRYQRFNYRVGNKVKHKNKYLGPVQPVNKSQRKKGGRKAATFIRQLTVEERQTLIEGQQNPKAFIRDRAKILLLSFEGKTPKQIADQMRRGYGNILEILKNFNTEGLRILSRKTSTGRPPRISKEQKIDLVETALKSPKEANLIYNNWSCRLLSLWFKEKYKQKISDEWVRTLLRRNKVTFTMPKHKMLKAESQLQGAFKKS